jgi:ribonuclease HI
MILRGNRVLARCDDRGELAVARGTVEVRYGPSSPKAYRAAPRNLEPTAGAELLPDDHCVEAEAAGPSASGKRKKTAPSVLPPSEATGDEILVYADGACSGNPGPAGLGVVMLQREGRRELSEYLGQGTNNIAELTAILRAAEAVEEPSRPVRIYTDSNYSIGVLTKGWKVKANKELVAAVKTGIARLRDVELRHVPGHAGVPLNERADELAVEAVESRTSPGWRAV